MSSQRKRPATRLLEPAEERDLIGRWTGAREQAALDAIVAAHRPLVLKIASRYRASAVPLGDLIQEGQIGLLEAAHRFDSRRDVRFATYAQWWIKSAIQEYVLRNGAAVRAVTSSRQKSLMFALARLAGGGNGLAADDRAYLARRYGVSLAAVDRTRLRIGARDQSLEGALMPGSGVRLIDTIADEAPDPEAIALAADEARRRKDMIAAALAVLPERERRIVEERHLAGDAPLLREIGRRLGISKERVRQLENRALARLRRLLSEQQAADAGRASA
jgi:RNA polymerase sigma-32 factor